MVGKHCFFFVLFYFREGLLFSCMKILHLGFIIILILPFYDGGIDGFTRAITSYQSTWEPGGVWNITRGPGVWLRYIIQRDRDIISFRG